MDLGIMEIVLIVVVAVIVDILAKVLMLWDYLKNENKNEL